MPGFFSRAQAKPLPPAPYLAPAMPRQRQRRWRWLVCSWLNPA